MKKFFKQRIMIRIVGCSLMMFGSMLSMNNTFAATSLTLTSSGSQSIDVLPAAGTAISSDAINVTTTCRYGYNFTVQTSVDDTTLYLDGNSDGSAYTYFLPASGFDPLNETENEWGYFYDGNTVPTNTSIFSPVPSSLEEPAIIKAPLDSPASSDINDNFNIYYGVSASANAEKGTYKMIPDEHDNDGTIVYTATIADACTRYIVHFDPTSTATGSSVTGTGTMNDQTILEGVTTPLTSNGFTAPSGYYFAGWNTAQDGTGTHYADGQTIVSLPSDNVTLYAQWEINPAPVACGARKICYNSNASLAIGSMPNDQEATTDVTLLPSNYKRDGYGFAGWNTAPDGSGTIYSIDQEVNVPSDFSTNGFPLYATWIPSAGSLQNWNGCSSLTQDLNDGTADLTSVTALTDERDGSTYAVARLADGKCWMIENLRLDDSVELSSTNTNNPSIPLNNSWYYKNSQTTLTASNRLSSSTSTDLWCTSDSADCIDQSMLFTDYTTLFNDSTPYAASSASIYYSYGNGYNWYSATAGHGTYNKTSGDTSGDICPVGWRLPKGGADVNTNEFSQLDIALGGSGSNLSSVYSLWYSFPTSFYNAKSGIARYWTSSVYSYDTTTRATMFAMNHSSVYPKEADPKRFLGFVRCITDAQ